MSRLIVSITLLAIAASLTGCAVAPGYGYAYEQPYYPDYGYAYGQPYAPVYGTVDFWGGWGGPCCYYRGGGDWHGRGGWHGGGWHGEGGHGGGWHGGGEHGGYHGGGGSSWSGGGHGGHGH